MTHLVYLQIWERELAAGLYGQDRKRPSTWKLDGLYRAACRQKGVEELEAILSSALDNDAHEDTIVGLLDELEHERNLAHEAFLSDPETPHAAA